MGAGCPVVLVAGGAGYIYGDDYDTADGTCVRDYIHVHDLCEAHLLALRRMLDGGGSGRFNLGNGQGHSVCEVIEVAHKVTGKDIAVTIEPRRAGDPPVLVADAGRARAELGWVPRYAELEAIIAHAWAWEGRRSTGLLGPERMAQPAPM